MVPYNLSPFNFFPKQALHGCPAIKKFENKGKKKIKQKGLTNLAIPPGFCRH